MVVGAKANSMGAAGRDSVFEANVWGMMFYSAKVGDADNPAQVFGIHLYRVVGTVGQSLP